MNKTTHALLVLILAGVAGVASAQTPSLAVAGRDGTKTFTQQDLLARATQSITVPDALYGKPMTYRVIPLAEILKDAGRAPDDYVETRAADGFTIPLPGRLLDPANAAQAEAFLAIEDPAAKWAILPDNLEKQSAGPFYIVWKLTGPAHVSRDYWSAQLAGLKVIDSPLKRWPGHDVRPDVPAADRIRTGLDRYVALCVTCHKFNNEGGAGAAAGPDLGMPKNVVDAFDKVTLKKWIRSPKSVKADAKMPRFDDTALSDADLDAMIAWLAYKKQNP